MNSQRHLSSCPPAACQSQYVIREVFTDFPQIHARWQRDSSAVRNALHSELDLPYAAGTNCSLDLFFAGRANSPLLVFLHGGYWQGGDKSDVSFLASSFVKAGISVAIPNYTLAPAATIFQMLNETRSAIEWLWNNAARWNIDRERIYVMGHSAGGHLAAMMLTQAWMPKDRPDNGELIKAVFSISGLFDLRPLIYTSLNRALAIDHESVMQLSPVDHRQKASAPLYNFVGEFETPEFHVQAKLIHASWRNVQRTMIVPGMHHYTVLDPLADITSDTFAKVLQAMRH